MRPKTLGEILGQKKTVEQLQMIVGAAKAREEPMPHILCFGEAGSGKTTLARALGSENIRDGVDPGIILLNGANLTSPKFILPPLLSVNKCGIIFIDEIHRLGIPAQEMLYTAMEDFRVDMSNDINSESIDIEPFTLMGATTQAGSLTAPIRDRFIYKLRLQMYSLGEIAEIIRYNADDMGLTISNDAVNDLSVRSRGTPRVAISLLIWVRDFVASKGSRSVSKADVESAMSYAQIDKRGLSVDDRLYIETLRKARGPMGLQTISDYSGLDIESIQGIIEPWLIRKEIVRKTPKGRMLCGKK